MTLELDIVSIGMVTAVGLDAPSACAAMRARLDGFQETRFLGSGGEWLVGAPVPLPRNFIGEKRLAHLAAAAIAEAFEPVPQARADAALILCLAEEDRPGRLAPDGARLAARIGEIIDLPARHRTRLVAHGRPSGHVALAQARKLLAERAAPYVMIAGVDSYLSTLTIAHYLAERRLLTPANPNGFIPGEAAAALLCAPASPGPLRLLGLGLAREPAFIYNDADLPLRGDGMTSAYRAAFDETGIAMNRLGYRIADLVGEQYWFKQSALASLHLLRGRHEFQDLWSPGESLGNVGAAAVPLMIGMAWTAGRKGYAAGNPVLIEASGETGACGAAVFAARGGLMSNVFANGLEISGKAVNAKTIAAFPDVCFTPPENPATPPGVPVPYPSFGMAGDTEKGTASVFIGGKTVNIKNKSDLSKTSGTEAGCAAKKGAVTSKNTGKEYDNSWSNDVKFEGEPVIRFTDLATNNHSSPAANTPPWPIQCRKQPGWNDTCEKVLVRMTVYDPNNCDTPKYEAHHVIDNSSFTRVGARSATKESFTSAASYGARAWKALRNLFQKPNAHPGANYHEGDAPAFCLKDSQTEGEEHRKAHDTTRAEAKKVAVDGKWTYAQARAAGVKSMKDAANLSDEEAECVGMVLDAHYKDKMDCTDATEMRAAGRRPPGGTTFATGSGSSVPSSPRPP